jgi:flotillin
MSVNVVSLVILVVVVVGLVLLFTLLGRLYQKVGPNRALIVFGRGGTKVIVGGGTLVLPLIQSAQELSLELMNFDVAPNYNLYTNQGVAVKVEAITQLKVEGDNDKILRAASQFLSREEKDREDMVRQVMEGHLRGIVGQLTIEQLVKEPELVSARMRETVAPDLDKLGLEVVSFTLKDVSDDSGYITNMSRPEVARNKLVAEVAEAAALRDIAVSKAATQREAAEAEAKASQETVLAQTISKTAQAQAQRDFELAQSDITVQTAQQKAKADTALDIQTAIAQQDLVRQKAQVELITRQSEVQVQEAEGQLRSVQLVATVQRQAEADAQRVRIMAEAEALRVNTEAQGRAKAAVAEAEARARVARMAAEADAAAVLARETTNAEARRLNGQAEADAIEARGRAEAEAIRARGLAEAESLMKKVDALNSQGDAALFDTAVRLVPLIAENLTRVLSNVGNVTYVVSGDSNGVSGRLASEFAGLLPIVNSMVQSTTGKSLSDLMGGAERVNEAKPPEDSSESNGHAVSYTPIAPAAVAAEAGADSVELAAAASSDGAEAHAHPSGSNGGG